MSYTAQEIMRFIIRYKRQHDGNSPTVREIQDACGVSSTSMVAYYLGKLEDVGLIRRGHGFESRAIEVVGGRWMPPGEVGA